MQDDPKPTVPARCDACQRELHPVWGATTNPDYQLADAAWLEVHGGYGMAVDNVAAELAGQPDVRVCLCASCLFSAMSHLGLLDRLYV